MFLTVTNGYTEIITQASSNVTGHSVRDKHEYSVNEGSSNTNDDVH